MVKVGIVGTGAMGKAHIEAYRLLDHVEVAGILGANEAMGREKAKKFGCDYFADFESMLRQDDIQIIDICLPTYLHEGFVVKAAAAGKHVICEKPFALTLEAADRMMEATQKAGVRFMIAQVLRFWPEYVKIKELYDNGSLGKVNIVYANRLAQHPNWGDWFADVALSGGGLFDMHSHDIDYLRYLFGPVESIYAVGKKYPNGAWNHVVTNLSFANGTKAIAEGCFQMPQGYPFTMTFRAIGDEAGIDFNFSAGFNLEHLDSAKHSINYFKKGHDYMPLKIDERNPYAIELEYFIDCAINGKEPEVVLPEDSRETLRILHAIQRSLETGEIQHLQPLQTTKCRLS